MNNQELFSWQEITPELIENQEDDKFFLIKSDHNYRAIVKSEYENYTKYYTKILLPFVPPVNQNSELKYRVGRKEGRAILEIETGKEHLIFPVGSDEAAKEYCDFLNNKSFAPVNKEIIVTDKMIEKEIDKYRHHKNHNFIDGFKSGAKWMRSQLLLSPTPSIEGEEKITELDMSNLLNKFNGGEISFSKMIKLINEKWKA